MKTLIKQLPVLVLLILISCSDDEIDGVGPTVTEELTIPSFDKIDFQIAGKVTIIQGLEQSVMVTSQANIIDRLNTNVDGDTWQINLGDGSFDYRTFDVVITIPEVSGVALSGTGSISLRDFNLQNDIQFQLRGSGDIEIGQLEGAEDVDVEVSGSGTIEVNSLSSTLNDLDIEINGSGNFLGLDMPTRNCSVDISGSGVSEVNVIDRLEVDISGSGMVFYRGQPSISQSISGSGRLENAN